MILSPGVGPRSQKTPGQGRSRPAWNPCRNPRDTPHTGAEYSPDTCSTPGDGRGGRRRCQSRFVRNRPRAGRRVGSRRSAILWRRGRTRSAPCSECGVNGMSEVVMTRCFRPLLRPQSRPGETPIKQDRLHLGRKRPSVTPVGRCLSGDEAFLARPCPVLGHSSSGRSGSRSGRWPAAPSSWAWKL